MLKASPKTPLLGEVELAILEHLWTITDCDVSEAHTALLKMKPGIVFNTVGSALERLHKKGLVLREKVSHAYRYQAALDRETFRARKLIEAAGGLKSLSERGLLVAFVDLVADSDKHALAELDKIIQAKKKCHGR